MNSKMQLQFADRRWEVIGRQFSEELLMHPDQQADVAVMQIVLDTVRASSWTYESANLIYEDPTTDYTGKAT